MQNSNPQAHKSSSGWLTIEPAGTIAVNIPALPGIDATGSQDATAIINAANQTARNLAPGSTLIDNFGANSDTYDVQGEITLYSNMTINGGGAEIVTNPKADWQASVGQFVNQDATPQASTTPPGAPINQNISIKGLVFYYPKPVWNVPIWIQNAKNIDIQNDVFMAASNGQQFYINVENAIVANVISVGNINGALNGWNGLQNIAMTGTYVANSGSATGSGGSWFNAIANPGGVLGGAQSANYAVGNTTQGLLPGGDAMSWSPLGPGVTANAVDIFGNMDAINGIPSTFGYIQTNTQNSYQVYNIAVGYVGGNPEQTNLFNMSSSGTANGYPASQNDVMAGNLAVGSTRSFQDFQAVGANMTVLDNALVGGESGRIQEYQPLVSSSGADQGTVAGQTGQLTGSSMVGGPVTAGLTLHGPLYEHDIDGGVIALSGITLSDATSAETAPISLTASALFGTVAAGTESGGTISFSGDLSQAASFLNNLAFQPGTACWDDIVHLEATEPGGTGSVWDIPITVGVSTVVGATASTYSLAANSFTYDPTRGAGLTLSGGESLSTLAGTTLVGAFGSINATLAGNIHTAIVGSGGGTITGTTIGQAGVIAGIGTIDALLTLGGNDTVTPGMAPATIDAALGNDLIQSNEGFVLATLGAGQDTVVLGLAGGDIIGGTGFDTIINLPDNAGPVNLSLGSGGGDVYLLSGADTVTTTESAASCFQFGIGSVTMTSHGEDTIRAGAGRLALTVGVGAADVVEATSGMIQVAGAGGDLYIDPVFTEQAVANASTLAVAAAQQNPTTYVAALQSISGTFGQIGGAILENSTFSTGALIGSSALVGSDVTVTGSTNIPATLSMDGHSILDLRGSQNVTIGSLSIGAVIEAPGSNADYEDGTLIIGNMTCVVSAPAGDEFVLTGGSNGTVSATLTSAFPAILGAVPSGVTVITLPGLMRIPVDSTAATAVRDVFDSVNAEDQVKCSTIDLTGTVKLSPGDSVGSANSWLVVDGADVQGTLTLSHRYRGEIIEGTGDPVVVSEGAASRFLLLGASTDVIWNDRSNSGAQTVIGAGATNTLNISSTDVSVFEAGGRNTINIFAQGVTAGALATITTASDASDLINIAEGNASIRSSGKDTITLASTVSGSCAILSGSASCIDIRARAHGDHVTVKGVNESVSVEGTQNTIVVQAAANVEVSGKDNVVVVKDIAAHVVASAGNRVVGAGGSTLLYSSFEKYVPANAEAVVLLGANDTIQSATVSGSSIRAIGVNESVLLGPSSNGNAVTVEGGKSIISMMGTNERLLVNDDANSIHVGGENNSIVVAGTSGLSRSDIFDSGRGNIIRAEDAGDVQEIGSNNIVSVAGATSLVVNGKNNRIYAKDISTISGAMSGGKIVVDVGVNMVDFTKVDGNVLLNDSVGANVIANGDNIVYSGTGGYVWIRGGKNAVTLDGSANMVGAPAMLAEEGAVTVNASGNDVIFGVDAQITCIQSSGNITITGGVGSVHFEGGAGSAAVHGGSAGHNVLKAGSCAATLFGAGNDNILVGGSCRSTLVAGSGTTTLIGGSGTTEMSLGSGDDTVVASSVAGAGTRLLVDSQSALRGADVVLGWKAHDFLELADGTRVAGERSLAAGGVQLSLSSGGLISFTDFVGTIATQTV